MEQFSLEKWLQEKSRKVVTRDGREVEIFHSNVNKTLLICRISDTEIYQYTKDGFQCDTMNQAKNDLFFADEELNEFEKRFIDIIRFWMSGNTNPEENLIQSQFDAKELLDLARKELEKEYRFVDKDDNNWEDGYKRGYKQCKQDTEHFSELKESGDEKIRKDLIEFVNEYGDNFYGQIAKNGVLSWLEKQGK